ncbi:trypsin-like serine protease [Streptomyces sp. BG9H]|uniref:Trypsin-like serine protease n=1 Tax=Streptomyces anatolicus TaxID=2675858 RepID=A0ABS6YHL9_9ACTN|nr:trypsin-like serine protease [Streptomyces anatolicus]MBW5420086.1 trypsin-like serine protease [Streptomyces anatolicus]
MQVRKLSVRAAACAAGLATTLALGAVGQATAAPAPASAPADTPAYTAAAHSTAGAVGTTAASPKKTGAQPIIGGRETQAQPYHARVLQNGQGICTATLVSARHILTAKHCVDRSAQYTFRIGSTYASSGGTMAAAARVTLHPSADLAMVRLDRDVTLTPAKIASTYPQTGTNVSVYGWGATCRDNESTCQSPVLKTAAMRMTGLTTDHYGGTAIALQGVDGVAAGGDSGGPAMVGGTVVGVASTSDRQSRSNYTATAAYTNWIQSAASNG